MSLESFFHRGAAPSPPKRIIIRRRLLGRGNRLRTLGMAAGVLSLGLTLGQPARAATVQWDGMPADWFSSPSNWIGGGYPGPGDDARNTFTNAAMTLGQDASVNSFISNSAFTLNGGTFSGSTGLGGTDTANLHTLQINNIFTVNGGQVNNFTINAGTQQAGQPAPSVIVTTNGGNSLSNTIVNANLDMATNSNAYLQLFNTNTFNGLTSLGAGGSNGLHLYDTNANLVNNGTLTGFGDIIQDNGGATVTNNATINANNAAGLTLSVSNFNNNAGATLEATNGGALGISNTFTTNSGALNSTGAGSLVTLTNGTTFTGTGTAAQGNLITASGGGKVVVDGSSLLGTINTAGAGTTTGTALIFTTNGNNSLDNTTVNGNLDLSTNGNAYLQLFNTNTFNGLTSLGAGGSNGLHLYDGNASLVNNSTLTGFGDIIQDNGGATVTNNATINASNTSGQALTVSVTNFNNNAGATAKATGGGVLDLNSTTTTNSGALIASGGGTINLINGNTLQSSAGNTINTAGGTFNVEGGTLLGTLNGVGASSLVFNTDGRNTFNGTTANINLDLSTNGNAYLRLFGANTFNGLTSLGAGGSNGLHLYDGNASLVNNSTLTGFGDIIQDNGGATVTNNATINASNSGGSPLTVSVTNFNNSAATTGVGAHPAGTLEATNGGVLDLNSTTTTNSGALIASGGGTINLINGNTLQSSAGNTINTAGGTFNVEGGTLLGTLNGVGASSLVFNTDGRNTFNGTTANINLDLSTNGNAYLRLFGANTFNGLTSLGAGGSNGLHLYDGNASLVNNSTLTGFGDIIQDNGGATVTNNATINADNANGLTLGVSNFTNSAGATLEATNGGALGISNTFTTNSGALNSTGAGSLVTLTNGTTFTGSGSASSGNLITASDGGKVVVDGSALRGTINTDANTALIFTTNGNNNLDNTTVNGNLDLATNNNAYLQLFGTDTINGSTSLGAGGGNGLHLYDGNANLVNNGTLSGFGSVTQDNGGATVTNNGTINADNAAGLTIGVDNFHNAGTTQVTNGATFVVNSGNVTNSGTVNVQSGGTANFSNGLTQTDQGLTQVDGVLNLANNSALTLSGTNNGGTLKGSGQINGNVVNTNGTVNPGDSPGTLAINGNFTQNSGGTLDIEFNNAANDLLTVTGLATTGGTLDVNYIGTTLYTGGLGAGSKFAFLDYGTLAAPTVGGLTQFFSNEVPDPLDTNMGTIVGNNGFTYELINDTATNSLDLEVLTAGTPAVPEASTTVSFGLLLVLGVGGIVVAAKRKKSQA